MKLAPRRKARASSVQGAVGRANAEHAEGPQKTQNVLEASRAVVIPQEPPIGGECRDPLSLAPTHAPAQ